MRALVAGLLLSLSFLSTSCGGSDEAGGVTTSPAPVVTSEAPQARRCPAACIGSQLARANPGAAVAVQCDRPTGPATMGNFVCFVQTDEKCRLWLIASDGREVLYKSSTQSVCPIPAAPQPTDLSSQ